MNKKSNINIPESIKSYKIEKETYKILNTVLYTAINTDINEKVLIHIFTKEKIKTSVNEVNFMNNHVYLMKLLNHQNILKLYEIIETKTHAFLIYEYFEGKKLSDYISKKKKLTEEESMTIFKEILSALIYIHEMYLCDLNISSNNILIDEKNNIKLCDFKYGHFYSTKEKSRADLIGDHGFASPELHSKKAYNPELADMWSCGVLLYQMLTGSLPFKAKKDVDMIRAIIVGNYSLPNTINASIKTLIKGLIEKNEEKRFKINDLFNQKYFKDKKITKESLGHGLNLLSIKYPIDEIPLNICKNNFGIDDTILIKNLENNKFTPITSLYKQIVSKLKNKGIPTLNDLISTKFKSYLKNHENYLSEEEQINNIQNYLIKEEEVRKNSKDIAAILLNNQNEISKGLEDLKKQFENAKKGVKPRLRQRSVDFGRKRRETFQFEDDKSLMKKFFKNKPGLNYNLNDSMAKKKNVNIKPVKRNTLFGSEIKGLRINNQNNKNSNKKGAPPKSNNIKTKDNHNKLEMPKPIEEIKEEHKENELNESHSNKSISSHSSHSSNKSQNSKKSDEKKENEEKKEEKKEEKEEKNEEKKEELVTPQKPNVEEKEEEVKINKKSTFKKKSENKTFNPMAGVKLNKVVQNNTTSQKPKKPILHNQKNDMNAINKKLENNDKKIKLNLKKEEIEREMNIIKIKSDLKKGANSNKSAMDIKSSTATKKTNEAKVQGFRNIKDMIESNLKKQRVMSGAKSKNDNKGGKK